MTALDPPLTTISLLFVFGQHARNPWELRARPAKPRQGATESGVGS